MPKSRRQSGFASPTRGTAKPSLLRVIASAGPVVLFEFLIPQLSRLTNPTSSQAEVMIPQFSNHLFGRRFTPTTSVARIHVVIVVPRQARAGYMAGIHRRANGAAALKASGAPNFSRGSAPVLLRATSAHRVSNARQVVMGHSDRCSTNSCIPARTLG